MSKSPSPFPLTQLTPEERVGAVATPIEHEPGLLDTLAQMEEEKEETLKKKRNYTFSIDVESLGFQGEGFAVGAVVLDHTGKEVASFYSGCPIEECRDYSETHPSLPWLKENVLPHHVETTNNPETMRDLFWDFYHAWTFTNHDFVIDCGIPVEANFLKECIEDFPTRKLPYPIHELATALYLQGKDPIGTYSRLPNELPAHQPLNDARQSARLWFENTQAL